MTIRFILSALYLSPVCLTTISVDHNWGWVERLNDIVIEPYELKAILLISLGLLVWRLRALLISFTDKMIDRAYDFLFLFFKIAIVLFRLIASQQVILFSVGGLFFIIFLVINAENSKRKDYEKQPTPTASTHKLVDLNRKMNQAAHRYLLRKILKLKERSEDHTLAILAGAHQKNIPELSRFQFEPRQKFLLELLKAEKLAGYRCDFSDASLLKLDFSQSLLKAHDLEGVLVGANFSSAHLERSNFKGTDLRNANFEDAALTQAHFIDCNLIDANFEDANLHSTIFSGSRLKGARFSRTNLRQTFFKGAYLSGAIVASPAWIENYHRLNSYSYAFRIKWHTLVEAKDAWGKTVYVFQGDDPPLKAQKP